MYSCKFLRYKNTIPRTGSPQEYRKEVTRNKRVKPVTRKKRVKTFHPLLHINWEVGEKKYHIYKISKNDYE
jgi:hypothetical protein